MGTRRRRTSSGARPGERANATLDTDTKRQRREKGRRQREDIRRHAARRMQLRRIGVGLAVGVIVVAVAAVTVHDQVAARQRRQEQQALLARASKAADAAGCTGVRVVKPYNPSSQDRQHVEALPALSSYSSQPPASGPHFPAPLDSGVYTSPPPLGGAIHSLEHGAVEVWLIPSASVPEVSRIQSVLGHEDHVIVAPYSYPDPGGQLSGGRQMVLVAWHHLQYCNQVSALVAEVFVAGYDASTSSNYLGDAPEAGVSI
jgi:hypothetical protein